MQYRYGIIASMALVTLGACGGASTSDPSGSTTFKSFSKMPANGSTVILGEARTASFADGLTVSNQKGPNTSELTITNNNGNQQVVSASATGANVSFDVRNGDTITNANAFIDYESQNGRNIARVSNQDGADYNHQTFGAWLTGNNTTSGTIGTGSYGSKTSKQPKIASATYTGQALGIAADSTEIGTVVATSKLTTDFETYSFSTDGSLLFPSNGGDAKTADGLNLTGSGTISNTKISGNVTSDLTNAGSMSGNLYGPNGEEAGGTFSTSGGGVTYIGSFGGKR